MWFKMKRNNKKQILTYKIFWHRLIPFVIAEIRNHEWEGILKIEFEKKKKFKMLRQMYNKSGNWYILEGLDYFWFGKCIFTNTDKEVLYNDSLKLRFTEKEDSVVYNALVDDAKSDINNMWKEFYSKFKK